jgi:uncharacterized membrane-anchored protein
MLLTSHRLKSWGLAQATAWALTLGLAFVAPTAASAAESDMESAIRAMKAAQVSGPADIKLRDQATLKLPAGYVWVPEPAAGELMRAMGNHPDEREMGLILPQAEDQNWMIVADYESSGYIKDDDAKDWNVDDLFNSLKEGTEEANKDRAARGFTELEIIGWVEKPTYTAATHRLVWSMSAKDKGAPADAPVGINYNTYALGREGYVSMNLLTSLNQVEQDKGHVQTLLGALSFNEGKRYADFDSSTDKVAEYGLAALVGGLAAKKLGFFALAAAFLAKFAKVFLLGGVAALGVFTKFFKRKKD